VAVVFLENQDHETMSIQTQQKE